MPYFLDRIPNDLEAQLQKEYIEIKHHFQLGALRPSELNGGRFAEVMLRIFQHLLGIPITPFGTEITASEKSSIVNKCASDAHIDPHVRQKVTALTRLLLNFRNNRDVAHLGGFNANRIDAQLILSCANWIYAELVRVFKSCSLEEAQVLIDTIALPYYPVIFEIEGEEFIAKNSLTTKQQILVLVCIKKRDIDFLSKKTRDSNKSRLKKTLAELIGENMLALKGGYYYIMPNGINEINEERLLN
jgi:hypothetical protein